MSKPSKIVKFMESIKPTRIWIDGKSHAISKYDKKSYEENSEKYMQEYDINVIEDQFHTSFKLASTYYQKINTFGIFSVTDLEEDTRTKIKVPLEENQDEKIVIKGGKLEDVIDARLKMQSLISAIRDKYTAMQFIAIPVLGEEIENNFKEFKELLLKEKDNIKGFHESIFQKPERLHLTVAVFALMDEMEKSHAIKALEDCKVELIDPLIAKSGPLKLHIKGLDCMNNNHSKAHILYANAKFATETEDYSLQETANEISNYFYEKGLVRQPQDEVKLHVTLINTKYRKDPKIKRKWTRIPFDAKEILEKYKDYDFGFCDFDSIHLSHITKIDEENGFYKPLSKINVV